MKNSQLKEKIELIRKLVKAGRGKDLVLMTAGLLECCNKTNDRFTYPDELKRPDPQGNIATLAFDHLEFTAKFGEKKLSAQENGYDYFAYPEEYEKWLEMGAPGIFLDELIALYRKLSYIAKWSNLL